MPTYTISTNKLEIDFQGKKPDYITRNKMKKVKIWWDPKRMIWHGPVNRDTLDVVKSICEKTINLESVPPNDNNQNKVKKNFINDYALKLKVKDIVSANKEQIILWVKQLKSYVNLVMGDDNAAHSGNFVSKSQESVWMNCFDFIASNLINLDIEMQEFELIFEYSLPGTVHERPDVFLLTNNKVISLEFKCKSAPQIDENKDDVAQAIRYKEWVENHHRLTRDRNMKVLSYLVCTHPKAVTGKLRGITILTKDNFCEVITRELVEQEVCSFSEEWLSSPKTEMPDMLQAIELMYKDRKIPYISDVNQQCLTSVLHYIEYAKNNHKKILILINGVPGAGKTAVGQNVVFEENKNGEANAVYLSGNGPLVEVLQYQINQVGKNKHMGENAIQGMKDFKSTYFSSIYKENIKVPQQSILIFDEAQRAWDKEKLKRGFSEPEGLFNVCERIYKKRGYAVLIGLYGNGQVIYNGEETGLELWDDSLKKHEDWIAVVSENLSEHICSVTDRKIVDNDVYLPVSLRADFIDCSKWVEEAVSMNKQSIENAKYELCILQNTSMRIFVTRNVEKIRARIEEISKNHPEWKYGILVSNFAEQEVITKAFQGWDIGYKGANAVNIGEYGPWFAGKSKELNKACSVYGNQGLELDCPIILFWGSYIRKQGHWVTNGCNYNRLKTKFKNPSKIVENNFRILLTRARKEMILLIPKHDILDETYQYFIEMGVDEL